MKTLTGPSRRLAFAALIGLLAMEVVYLVAANHFLSSPLFDRAVNGKPLELHIRYDSAWTVLPGLVHIRGFRIESQSNDIRWSAELTSARAFINVPALLFRKFEALSVVANGGRFALDPDQPRIPKVEPEPSTNPQKPKKRKFRVAISGIDLRDFDTIRFHHYAYQGPARIEGAFLVEPGAEIQVYRGRVSFGGGELHLMDQRMNRRLTGVVDGSLRDVNPKVDKGAALFDRLSARVELSGEVADVGFLNRYLRGIPWLKVVAVNGDFSVDARIENGAFAEGTHATIKAPQMGANLGNYAARGAGSLHWTLDDDALVMRLGLSKYEAFEPGKQSPFMRGSGLELSAGSRDLRLRSFFSDFGDLDATLKVPKAEVTDLRFLNAFVPTEQLEVTAGVAEFEAALHVSTTRKAQAGFVKLSSRDLAGRYKSNIFKGNFAAETRFTDSSRGTNAFKVEGAELNLSDVVVSGPDVPKREKPWGGRVALTDAQLKTNGPEVFAGAAQLHFDDARPLLTLLAADSRVARILSKIAGIENVRGTSDFALGPGLIRFSRLQVKSSDLNVEAEIRILRKTQNIRALIEYGILEIGVDIEGGKSRTKLIGARKWLQTRRPWDELKAE